MHGVEETPSGACREAHRQSRTDLTQIRLNQNTSHARCFLLLKPKRDFNPARAFRNFVLGPADSLNSIVCTAW